MERNNMYQNRIAYFYGQKYAFLSGRMKTYVQAQGFELCQSIVDGYKEPDVPPTNENGRKLSLNNS
jgi:hypothetical protein